MKQIVLPIIFIAIYTCTPAQNADLKQAIKHYESKNLGLAEKEIEQAAQASITSEDELSKVMNYYFLIKADLYCVNKDILEENISIMNSLAKAYGTCIENDKRDKYSMNLKSRVRKIIPMIEEIGEKQYANAQYFQYFYTMSQFINFHELVGNEVGPSYQQLANQAYETDNDLLGIKFNFKMIEIEYDKKSAYTQALMALHRIKKYDKVDQLLKEAKDDFPDSYSFASIEILRMLDKDMKFTAVEYSEKALKSDPNNVEALYMHGKVNDLLNEHERALVYYERALQINPIHLQSNLAMAIYYYKFSNRAGHLALAKTYLEKVLEINPKNKVAVNYLEEIGPAKGKEAILISEN